MAAERLTGILKEHGPASIAVIGSNRTTNEENYLLGRFARTVLGTNNLDHHRTADFPSLVGALTAAKADGRYATIEDIAEASSILVVGNDPTHQHPLIAYQIRQAVRQHDAHLYLLNSQRDQVATAGKAKRHRPGRGRSGSDSHPGGETIAGIGRSCGDRRRTGLSARKPARRNPAPSSFSGTRFAAKTWRTWWIGD